MVLMERQFLASFCPLYGAIALPYLPAAPLKGSQCFCILPDAHVINATEKHMRKGQSTAWVEVFSVNKARVCVVNMKEQIKYLITDQISHHETETL